MVAELFKFLSTNLSGASLYIVVAVIGCVVMVPQVVKVWDSWKDFRSGKGELAVKKMQLEVLKLRYEVELMKDKLNRPLDAEIRILATPAPIESHAAPQTGPAQAIGHPKQWVWLRKLASHNRFGANLLLMLLRVLAWIALVSFGGFLAATLYYIKSPPKDMTTAEAASTLIVFLPGTLACYLAVHRLKIQSRMLSRPPESRT